MANTENIIKNEVDREMIIIKNSFKDLKEQVKKIQTDAKIELMKKISMSQFPHIMKNFNNFYSKETLKIE